MGFEINGGFNKPVIKESQQTHDGGAGNTGYFEQERKQHEHEKSIFDDAKKIDSFEKESTQNNDSEDFSFSKLIAQIILAVKDWLKKTFNL
jgi:hypothetical protein